MIATKVKHMPLPSEPIVIIRVPDIRMGNQTYLGVTSPGVGDYANDDQ